MRPTTRTGRTVHICRTACPAPAPKAGREPSRGCFGRRWHMPDAGGGSRLSTSVRSSDAYDTNALWEWTASCDSRSLGGGGEAGPGKTSIWKAMCPKGIPLMPPAAVHDPEDDPQGERCPHTGSLIHRRASRYASCHGGMSFGMNRHCPPVLTKYGSVRATPGRTSAQPPSAGSRLTVCEFRGSHTLPG
jgi:hypothetical protein